jgi:hypothetical protein
MQKTVLRARISLLIAQAEEASRVAKAIRALRDAGEEVTEEEEMVIASGEALIAEAQDVIKQAQESGMMDAPVWRVELSVDDLLKQLPVIASSDIEYFKKIMDKFPKAGGRQVDGDAWAKAVVEGTFEPP